MRSGPMITIAAAFDNAFFSVFKNIGRDAPSKWEEESWQTAWGLDEWIVWLFGIFVAFKDILGTRGCKTWYRWAITVAVLAFIFISFDDAYDSPRDPEGVLYEGLSEFYAAIYNFTWYFFLVSLMLNIWGYGTLISYSLMGIDFWTYEPEKQFSIRKGKIRIDR
jgi:hypothetical protein